MEQYNKKLLSKNGRMFYHSLFLPGREKQNAC